MSRWSTLVAVVMLVGAAACSSNTPETDQAGVEPSAEDVQETTEYDPYERWIELGGPELWEQEGLEGELSREDAQTRALLGCDQEWAPGTIDALLAEAYRAVDGFCEGT